MEKIRRNTKKKKRNLNSYSSLGDSMSTITALPFPYRDDFIGRVIDGRQQGSAIGSAERQTIDGSAEFTVDTDYDGGGQRH